MSSMKKRARENCTGKFAPETPVKARGRAGLKKDEFLASSKKRAAGTKKRPGRPKLSKHVDEVPLPTLEVSVTIAVGGADVDRALMQRINTFLVERTHVGKCSLERGGAAFHLHFQMVARLQAKSTIAVSKVVKTYLGWDVVQPAGGMVMCRRLTNRRLHTFHGLLGYCMKDASREHFETVDHNVAAEDIALGLEQYALFGQEESKNRVPLTMKNLVDRVFMWRKYNCKHPLVVDFGRDLYKMLKTGKYYPATSWVIVGCGKGYEPSRMQSLYKIMVMPVQITRQDVANVFEAPESERVVPRSQWFPDRWQDVPKEVPSTSLHNDIQDMKEAGGCEGMRCSTQACMEVGDIDVLCDAAIHSYTHEEHESKKKQRKKSPTNYLWPEEWRASIYASPTSSTVDSDGEQIPECRAPDYVPLYAPTEPLMAIL